MSWSAIGWNATCAIFVLAITFFCFARGWIGGGDAKLASATTLWVGWDSLDDYSVLFGLMAVRRQNVLQSMWSGRVAGKGPDLVPHNRSWLAMLLGAVVVVFAVWYWQDASQRLPDGVSMPSLSQLASQGGHDDDDD